MNLRLDLEKLDVYVEEAHEKGWSVGIHVMGDLAIDAAVDAIYRLGKRTQENIDTTSSMLTIQAKML